MKFVLRASAFVLLVAVIAACDRATPAPATTPAPTPVMSAVDRGKYIVTAGMCHDCHTPAKMGPNGPEPDMARMLSGHPEGMKVTSQPKLPEPWMFAGTGTFTAWSGPWGISFSANLTPDQNTGLGIWTEAMFLTAMREGKHMGTSRPILPPMPWQVIRNYNDEDLKAIFAYLKSIPPVTNHVPEPIPPGGAK
jgi:cytochrome c553